VTNDKEIRTASSITDYIFRRLALDYLSFDDRLELGLADLDDMPVAEQTMLNVEAEKSSVDIVMPVIEQSSSTISSKTATPKKDITAPLCYNCGNQTQRAGSCYVCSSCGSTTGCS